MITKHALKALAIALPLSLGAVAPALADDYDRYDRNGRYENDGHYDRDYDRDRYRRDYDDYRRPDYDYDYQRGHHRFLSSREIRHRLSARGYSRIRDIGYSRRQGHYHVVANDTLGSTFRLSVSAYSGRVIHRQFLYGPRYRHYERNYYDRYY